MMENEEINSENQEIQDKPVEEEIKLPLEEGDPSEEGYHFPWSILIIGGILLVAIVACIVVIMLNGGVNA